MLLGAAYGAISRDYFGRGVSTPGAKASYKVVVFVGGYSIAHRRRGTGVRLCQCGATKRRAIHVIQHGVRNTSQNYFAWEVDALSAKA